MFRLKDVCPCDSYIWLIIYSYCNLDFSSKKKTLVPPSSFKMLLYTLVLSSK